MTAKDLLFEHLHALGPDDTSERALAWMDEFHVRHLPVISEEGAVLGLVAEEQLLDMPDPDSAISALIPELTQAAIQETHHLYEVLKMMVEQNLTVLPVIDKAMKYVGAISLESLLKAFAELGAVAHPGGVLVIDMDARDYALSTIARLIEGEKAIILSSYITSQVGSTRLQLTLKLNTQDLRHIVATLQRFGFDVQASFQEDDYLDTLRERYDLLMNYLSI